MERSSSSPGVRRGLDRSERSRIFAMAVRLRTARDPAIALLTPALLLAVFTYGAAILWFIGGLLAGFALLGLGMRHTKRPEWLMLGGLVWAQLMIAGIIAVADRYGLDALGLLLLPAVAACLTFPRQIAGGFIAWTVVAMAATAFLVDPAEVAAAPPILILPVGVLLCVSLPAVTVRSLEMASRDAAMIDPLTGVLNRTAMELRIAELTEQSFTLPLRLGVVMIDIDHFKAVNDELGHTAGDHVLCETARRMRAELGPLTPVYRAGGEEFVVLVAGAEESTIADVGERLRVAVGTEPIEGRRVTISAGVAASTLDRESVKALLAQADEALYEAKRGGRDRVAMAAAADHVEVSERPERQPGGASAPPLELVQDRAPHAAPVRRQPLAAASLGNGGNWLVRGDFEREHIRSSARAMAGTHHAALGMIGLALALSIPWLGWHLMVPAILPVIVYHVVERRVRVIRRPEYVLGAAWAAVQLGIFGGALIVDPGEPYMLVLFVPMMIAVTAVFPSRGILVASIFSIMLASLGGALARPDLVSSYPGLLIPPMLMIAGFALMSSVAGRSAIDFSTQAIVDPVTGLLTRAALRSRLDEIGKQTTLDATPVALIVFDIDHFKSINDRYGHATGDAVLRAAGEATRSHLRALEWGFRIGGDEFLIVVPGGEAQTTQLASTLRAALAAIDVDGVGVTGSFGVAASAPGEAFDFELLSERADGALYEAKRAGRNRVGVAPDARHITPRVVEDAA